MKRSEFNTVMHISKKGIKAPSGHTALTYQIPDIAWLKRGRWGGRWTWTQRNE